MSPSAGHHGELLRRSTEQMVVALRELRAVSEEMVVLLDRRLAGVGGVDEARLYAELRRREQRAHRHYLAAQRWHDAVRRRIVDSRDHLPFM